MNESTQAISAASKPGGELIADRELCDLVRTRGRTLLELARSLAAMRAGEVPLTRPLIGRLLLESGQMETLLDEYGARQNQHWSRFRALMAALKNFARIGEVLAYIHRRLPAYRLLPVEGRFRGRHLRTLAAGR
jgi:hypothetical protein